MTDFVKVSKQNLTARNTKGGSITILLTSCLTGLDMSVLQIKTKNVTCHTADYKQVKQEVNGTVILPPLVFHPHGIEQPHLYLLKGRSPERLSGRQEDLEREGQGPVL